MADDLKISAEKGQAIGRQAKLPQLLEKLKASAKPQEADAAPALPEQLAVEKETPIAQNEITQENDKPAKASVCANTDSSGANTTDEKIKVSTARLDDLINMAGELVIAQLMVGEEAAQSSTSQYELNRKIAHQGKIVRRLQELSMSMRMVPIAGVFQKMTRLVRDLAQKSGKQVNLITFGEETELDRNVVDKISDPLVHMIRNSADHGIESPQDRKNAGKDVIGQIKLRAFHQAGNIVIQIEDDGKGLDKERIRKKAIDAGLIGADQSLTDDQIYRLIFHAGLSTAEKITAVSGRGVGMDVVKKNIELLRGKIDIASTYGKGTIFTIRLPLTLATIDGQVVRVGQNRYLIPINSIVATFRPKVEQLSSVNGRGELVMVRGQLLPLIRMNKLFNIDQVDYDPTESLLIIVEDDGKRCSLLVDDLLSQQQVVIKSLGDGLGKVKGVSGSAIMGNGMVSLILDIPGIMKLSQI
jgi:two-component system chemotaxis sensor kinase CheA